ncbi:hypothetical protein N878_07870 [Pseudomonas sp. EGD-AK9]|uniref:Sec-independent protein translocase protein TatB n=1 Tax=Pseudomonas sp. EGD-AK9 TaxID=1386078 RepID=UPI0003982944|nr:Sec-independent protein translocase protein TatB [Pseudomonas sp. EGD-AK9]ERI50773.1 hypothetical protein N878_07870 [Pseudomonas sp. EGD-AK9]
MFDIGFTELILIGVVALLVLGPERLPSAVRTAGLWIGQARRSFANIRSEVEREIGADEIRRQLHNNPILDLEREMKQSIMPSSPTGNEPLQSATPQPNVGDLDVLHPNEAKPADMASAVHLGKRLNHE